jgi:hypothetical protein
MLPAFLRAEQLIRVIEDRTFEVPQELSFHSRDVGLEDGRSLLLLYPSVDPLDPTLRPTLTIDALRPDEDLDNGDMAVQMMAKFEQQFVQEQNDQLG